MLLAFAPFVFFALIDRLIGATQGLIAGAAVALAFVVLVTADLTLLYAPNLPPRVGIIATILALAGAIKFTAWYPKRTPARAVG